MAENNRPEPVRVKKWLNWLLGAIPLLLLVLGLLLFLPRSGQAAVELDVEDGNAVWYYHLCQENESAYDVASWAVSPQKADDVRQVLMLDVNNGYPGYRLTCRLHLANSGSAPLRITNVRVKNPHLEALDVTASIGSNHSDNVLQPCGGTPSWGTEPSEVPAECQQEIELSVGVLDGAEEGRRYGYTVTVGLSQALE